MTENEINTFLKKATHMVRVNIPFLSELLDHIEFTPTIKIETAGIAATGRLIYNPNWISSLSLNDAMFIIAHEIMHLALRSHDRSDDKDSMLFNITHDFIINNQLKRLLNFHKVPANGLDWDLEYSGYYNLENKSAEELLTFIRDAYNSDGFKDDIFRKPWASDNEDIDEVFINLDFKNTKVKNQPFADKLRDLLPKDSPQKKPKQKKSKSGLSDLNTDVITSEIEKILFPNSTLQDLEIKKKKTDDIVSEVLSQKLVMDKTSEMLGLMKGDIAGDYSQNYEAVRSFYKPPWEMALQNWLENMERTGRTYSRPSRRGQYNDFVRPGFKREGQTLHIVLDTSGSMSGTLNKILGVIASFCEALLIPLVHIIQCDTEISDDSWYTPGELANFEIKGLGGSDMSPGMLKLAEDDQVEHVIVITDGYINFPETSMPYQVLWVLDGPSEYFKPTYGKVITIE